MAELNLILLRHGDAVPEIPGKLSDLHRPLSPRGQRQVPSVSARLSAYAPTIVLVSPATRTRETIASLLSALPPDGAWPPATFVDALYLGRPADLRTALESHSLQLPAAMAIVGHNPGLSELAEELTGLSIDLGTAAAVALSHGGESWYEALADSGGWSLNERISPDSLSL